MGLQHMKTCKTTGRLIAAIHDNSFSSPGCAHFITKIIHTGITYPMYQWRQLRKHPEWMEMIDRWFDSFREAYDPEPGVDEPTFRRVFESHCHTRFRDTMAGVRKKIDDDMSALGVTEYNYADLAKPPFMSIENWKIVGGIWNSDSFKKLRSQGSANRNSAVEGSVSTHTGGSCSFVNHENRENAARDRPITMKGLYDVTHKSTKNVEGGVKKGQYICKKAQMFDDVYTQNYGKKYGVDVDMELHDDHDLFAESAESVNYGGSSYSQKLFKRKKRGSSSSAGGDQSLRDEVIRQREEIERQNENTEKMMSLMTMMAQQMSSMSGDNSFIDMCNQLRPRDPPLG